MQFTLSKENDRYNTALAEKTPALENMLTKHNDFIQQLKEDIKNFSDITVSNSTNFTGDYSVEISNKYGFRLEKLVLNNEEFCAKMSATGSVAANVYALYLPDGTEVMTYSAGYILSYNSEKLHAFMASQKTNSNSFSVATLMRQVGALGVRSNRTSPSSLDSLDNMTVAVTPTPNNGQDDTNTTTSPLHTHHV